MSAPLTLTPRGEILQWALAEQWEKNPSPTELVAAFRPEVVDHAIFMAEHGVSHRSNPLQVGAALLGLTVRGPVLFEGFNFSPYKGSPKQCAEISGVNIGDQAVAQQIEKGLLAPFDRRVKWKLLEMVVAASSNNQTNWEINNLDAPTLHPCGSPCRPWLGNHPSLLRDTLIHTVAVNLQTGEIDAQEAHTMAELDDKYAGVPVPPVSKQLLVGAGSR